MSSAGESTELQAISPNRVSARLGRLFETTLWRARPCSAVSGPLHPSRCHLQSSYSLGHRIRSPVPVEGLCQSQQEAYDDPHRRRIPSPISTACLAERFPRIRYFGWLANRKRQKLLPLCRLLAKAPEPAARAPDQQVPQKCPKCQGTMRIVERLTAGQICNPAAIPIPVPVDTS